MIQKIYKVTQILAFVPFMAIPSISVASNIGSLEIKPVTKVEVSVDDLRQQKADAIDSFFKKRSMPLEGTGMTFVLVAEKYGLDWRLLPAIGVRESSGGKAACKYNAFGWGSCKLHNFHSYEEAIEAVGRNLGGANPRTSSYYAGKTTKEKLYFYNGSVEPAYPGEVIAIMKMIESDTD
ncbi:MAG: glucosaminidase domain-containing protein [Candidatus Pacebacteria bacterium]|nr:glucosaminidase domain-containing protein [Candidatus Paceibacterota bacterium]